ncbi:MAG: VWA domain-containing protein, partial [Clostridia bacterium]|nr:VWA domain-containing protein [Clostridia bacterium]
MKSYDERAKEILSQRDEKVKESAIRRRKAGRLAVIAAVLALTIVGASVFAVIAYKAKEKPVDPTVTDTTAAADTAADTDKPADTTPKEYKDGVIGERDPSAEEPSGGIALDGRGYYSDKASGSKSGFSPAPTSPSEEAKIGYEYIEGYDGEVNAVDAAAGTLTAGEWKDADNIADWLKLLSKDEWKGFVNSRKLDTANIVTVKVTDGENACFNVPVKLLSGDEVIYTGKTDINGRVYLFGNITGNDKTADAVSVGEQTVALDGKTELVINAADAGVNVTALDLMLMIDTTGSMGDELEYIKAELYDVVERVAKAGESISIRVSVNFYRDEGDDYTVKFFDFREDINECIEQLKEQSAYGGGDYPEAVHTA